MNDLTLNLDPIVWHDASGGEDQDAPSYRSRIHYAGGVVIAGVRFHVTGIRVDRLDQDGVQQFNTDEWQEEDHECLELLTAAQDAGCGWQTVRIGETDYVLYLVPFSL